MSQLAQLKNELEKSAPIENALEDVLQKFYTAMLKDTMIGFFFAGKDINKIVQGQMSLLLTVMGVREKYTGVPVGQAHLNLPPILEGHFNRRLVILQQTLEKYNFSKDAVKDWLEFEKKFHNVIVKSDVR